MMAPGHHRPLCPPRGALRPAPLERAIGILGKPKHSVVRRTKSRLARRLCRLAQRKKRKTQKDQNQQQLAHYQKLLQASVSQSPKNQTPQIKPIQQNLYQHQEKAFMHPVSRKTNHLPIPQKPHTPNITSTTNLTITSKSTSPFIATSSPTTQKKSAGGARAKRAALGLCPLAALHGA